MEQFKFKLGEVLKDKITGFEGVVMARNEYYTGCNTYALCSQEVNKEGKPKGWEWLDETLLNSVNVKNVLKSSKKPNGGPHPNAPQM